jgi:hypothetical protein
MPLFVGSRERTTSAPPASVSNTGLNAELTPEFQLKYPKTSRIKYAMPVPERLAFMTAFVAGAIARFEVTMPSVALRVDTEG